MKSYRHLYPQITEFANLYHDLAHRVSGGRTRNPGKGQIVRPMPSVRLALSRIAALPLSHPLPTASRAVRKRDRHLQDAGYVPAQLRKASVIAV